MPETVKFEIELPKDKIEHILSRSDESSNTYEDLDKETDKELRIEKFKKQLAAVQEQNDNSESVEEDNNPTEQAKFALKSPSQILPQTSDTTPPNTNQKKVIIAGAVIAILGLILWPLANFVIATVIAIIGASIVATGTFVKI